MRFLSYQVNLEAIRMVGLKLSVGVEGVRGAAISAYPLSNGFTDFLFVCSTKSFLM